MQSDQVQPAVLGFLPVNKEEEEEEEVNKRCQECSVINFQLR